MTPYRPTACRQCNGPLQDDPAEPTWHQAYELPPIVLILNEYQLFRGHCSLLPYLSTRREVPEGVSPGQCGPRLAVFTGVLMGAFSLK